MSKIEELDNLLTEEGYLFTRALDDNTTVYTYSIMNGGLDDSITLLIRNTGCILQHKEDDNWIGCSAKSVLSYLESLKDEPVGINVLDTDAKNIGRKDDKGKLRYDLVPKGTWAKVVKVITFGANKYGDENWHMVVTDNPKRYYAAMLRHIEAWWSGEKNDPESGEHHLAHAVCCALFLMWGDDNEC